jgi:hypothetical protein
MIDYEGHFAKNFFIFILSFIYSFVVVVVVVVVVGSCVGKCKILLKSVGISTSKQLEEI